MESRWLTFARTLSMCVTTAYTTTTVSAAPSSSFNHLLCLKAPISFSFQNLREERATCSHFPPSRQTSHSSKGYSMGNRCRQNDDKQRPGGDRGGGDQPVPRTI